MKLTVKQFKKKEMPSKFGGNTWSIYQCQFNETGDTIYELNGFGKQLEHLAAGKVLTGYISERNWQNKTGGMNVTKMFNKITAEYVYELLLKINPQIEKVLGPAPLQVPKPAPAPVEDSWTTGADPMADVGASAFPEESEPGF